MQEAPKLVIHTLCGEPVFYYFGSKEDAEKLKNFDDITTLEGDSITPQDIMKCTNCGEKIRIDQVQIAVKQNLVINDLMIHEIENTTERLSDQEKEELTRRLREERDKLWWNMPNDPNGIHKNKPK